MRYYLVSTKYPDPKQLIVAVEVDRETDASVWINGRRHDKATQHRKYVSTYKEAVRLVKTIVDRKTETARIYQEEADRLRNAWANLPPESELEPANETR